MRVAIFGKSFVLCSASTEPCSGMCMAQGTWGEGEHADRNKRSGSIRHGSNPLGAHGHSLAIPHAGTDCMPRLSHIWCSPSMRQKIVFSVCEMFASSSRPYQIGLSCKVLKTYLPRMLSVRIRPRILGNLTQHQRVTYKLDRTTLENM